MRYRHQYHAGNFADVHKHVTLLSLLTALKRKDKGFLYLDTHAGRGAYDLSRPSQEAAGGIGRFTPAALAALAAVAAPELRDYAALLERCRSALGQPHLYPGSPLLALAALRSQDRIVLLEWLAAEAKALGELLAPARRRLATGVAAPSFVPAAGGAPHGGPRVHLERTDGYGGMRAWLPPPERRALTFLDPPYEQTRQDFLAVARALGDGLRRFPTGVFASWYPLKDERVTKAWQLECTRTLDAPLLVSELWLYPRDARVALNGSGVLIVNPPWRLLERMKVWLPQLQKCLSIPAAPTRAAEISGGGNSARMLRQSPP